MAARRGGRSRVLAAGGRVAVALIATVLVVPTGTADAASPPAVFAPYVDYEVDAGTRNVAIGDLDGDSHADLVTVGVDIDQVSVLFGEGDGTFGAPVEFGTGPVPTAVAIGDLDGDGDLDLVVTNAGRSFDYDDMSVSVLLNHGDGTFAPDAESPAAFGPVAVDIADVNGDTDLDLVITHVGFPPIFAPGRVSVRLGDGDGGFAPSFNHLFNETLTPLMNTAVADVTGDGLPDIVLAGSENPRAVWVLVGNGNGTFDAPVQHLNGVYVPGTVEIGDLDGDGANEVVVGYGAGTSTPSSYLAVLTVDADGAVTGATSSPLGTLAKPHSLALGDVNGDGHLDAAVVSDRAFVEVLLGNGDSTFDAATQVPLGPEGWATAVSLADLDGDDRLDMVTGHHDGGPMSVLLNTTVPVVPAAPTIGTAVAGSGSATVSWTAPAADGGSAVTGYVVTPYIGYYPLPSQSFASTATTQVVTGLANGTQYRFRVQAVNAVGVGLFSTVTNPVTPAAPTVPGAPTIGAAAAGNGEATVTWTAPAADGGSAVTGYVVTPYIGYYPLPSQTFASTATTQVVTGLANGTQYRFRVQAINAVGTSGNSKVTNPVIPTA